MDKLLKLEKYQLLHNSIYWCGMIGIFILGFFTADTYVTEVMGPTEEIASSLADIFNGMVYDSTFLLIIMSAILALILGQEFSKRTINLEVSAGHSRKQIFTSKIISYLIAFNLMALVYPVSGCIREFGRFGVLIKFSMTSVFKNEFVLFCSYRCITHAKTLLFYFSIPRYTFFCKNLFSSFCSSFSSFSLNASRISNIVRIGVNSSSSISEAF